MYIKAIFSNLEGYFTRSGDFTWRVSDSAELVGGFLQEKMGLVLCGFLL